MDRRSFIAMAGMAGMAGMLMPASTGLAFNRKAGYFRIEKRSGRYMLVSPAGENFFSIGINHLDSAGLRHDENIRIWMEKYENSMKKWLKEKVRPDLIEWGFNTLGWNQEVITRERTNHRHSRPFTPEEYRWLDMPYCHMLNFADFHQWEVEVRHPDFFSSGFSEWCDYVARDQAARLAEDPNLIGYFYIDCPTWVHTREDNEWKGPLFDPERLGSKAGRRELFEMATQYYKVCHDAIRRYDPNHLIFGDRYEAKAALPEEVARAAVPYVDALSFQHFDLPDTVVNNLNFWHEKTGMPTLVADGSQTIPNDKGGRIHDVKAYARLYELFRETPSCIGYHLCGAYLENRVRRKGMIDEMEEPYEEMLEGISRVNRGMATWIQQL